MEEVIKSLDSMLPLVDRQLLALIRLAITGKSSSVLEVCKIDWQAIYALAEKQSVVGIVFNGIERFQEFQKVSGVLEVKLPDMDLLMDWLGQAEYIKTQNEVANQDCERITKQFRDAGFRTSIMKGQGNARLYKAEVSEVSKFQDLSMLRNSGDIDLWVSGGTSTGSACNFERVNGYVQKVAPTKHVNELEIQFESGLTTPVEVHYRPFIMRNPITNRRLQKFFAEEAESCFGNGLFTTVRFNIVHQLAHVRLHLFTEGIGLRQLVDYYFVLKAFSEELRAESIELRDDSINHTIDKLGMKRFAEAMMWVMKEAFGLEDRFLLCEPDEKGGLLLINDVMTSGNFGRADTALQERKKERWSGVWMLLFRNLRYWRFDHWDWFWGPLWRIYHRIWRMRMGFE